MKPINCREDDLKSYLRCVNKDDLSYVDILIIRNMQRIDLWWYFVRYADEISGNWTFICDYKKKKYHYGILFCINDDGSLLDNTMIGFIKEKGAFYRLEIDAETNKITSKTKIL
jgi:hypothetical protein